MASPSLVSQEFSLSAGLTDTSFSPTLSAHAAGDMLEVDVGVDGNVTVTIDGGSGGWSLDWQIANTTGSATPTMAKLHKLAASSSESLTVGSGAVGEAWAASCRVYRGAGGTLNYFTASGTNGSGTDGQGNAISPGVGSQDFTFTQCMVMDGTQGTNAAPTGYTNYQTNNNAAAARVDVSTAELAATASSDTPDPWDSNAEQWIVGGGAVWETSGGTTHATSGSLVGPGATVDGTSAHIAVHGTTGALTGPGSSVTGSAARERIHPTSGDLVGPGAVLDGTSARTRVHPSSGVLEGPGSTLAGEASRTHVHPSTGSLVGPGSEIAGTAARTHVHPSSGDLVGPGAVVVGEAERIGAAVEHDTSGNLTGPGSDVSGTSARVPAPVTHDTSGVLIGPGAHISGRAKNGTARRHAGARKNYIIKGQKYALTDWELRLVIQQMLDEVKRPEVQVVTAKEVKQVSRRVWKRLKESLSSLEALTLEKVETVVESNVIEYDDEDDDELLMLL